MSDSASPHFAGHPAGHAAQALSPEVIDNVLADFRAWLEAAADQSAAAPALPQPAAEDEPIDLHTLLGQFVALRHEVNLQTRAVRVQQEQNTETLRQLSQALETLRDAQAANLEAEESGAEELLRPLLKTLVDLYDSLALAAREMQRVQQVVLPSLDQISAPEPAAAPLPEVREPPPSFWARWFGGAQTQPAPAGVPESAPPQPPQRRNQATEAVSRVRQVFDSLLTGYTMSLQRVERALHQHGLEPIPARDQPFDPERMEVVEVVSGTDRPANTVIDEVRRGYLWQGRVFRYAQVRVAKS